MTLLWTCVMCGAIVLAVIALRALNQQRRLFLTPGKRVTPSNPRTRADTGGARARDTSSAVGDRLRNTASPVSVSWSLTSMLARLPDRRFRRTTAKPRQQRPPMPRGQVSPPSASRRPRRGHAAHLVVRAMQKHAAAQPPPSAPAAVSAEVIHHPSGNGATREAAAEPAMPMGSAAGEGIVRVEPGGQLKFPDPVARDMLDWREGERALRDILAGGDQDAAALLDAVARQEVVEQEVTVRTGDVSQALHVTALASRARDGNQRGALLILRRVE